MSRSGPAAAASPREPEPASRPPSGAPPPSTAKLVLAFAAVYVIWGSTYLAIRIAIETIPPFTMAGVRFLVAGAILYPWARWFRKAPPPTAEHWRNTALLGGLLLLGGNGAVVWAEQWVPSGLAALLVAMVPLWMALVDWLWGGGLRPGPLLIAGLVLGLGGVALLASAEGFGSGTPEGFVGGLVILGGGFAWALGSIRSRALALPARPRLGTAMQMLWGGAMLLVAGAVTGELGGIDPAAFSLRSVLATGYLIVFGSLVAFSAYIWLLGVTTPARVSTYAYVNPVVALLLGWGLAGEPLTARTLLAAGIILASVALISRTREVAPDAA